MDGGEELDFDDTNSRAEKAKESILLMKKKMFRSHDLILQYNNKLKECDRLRGDLRTERENVLKLKRDNNLNLAKIIKLETSITGHNKNKVEMEKRISDLENQLGGDKSHIRQLVCKLEAIEKEHTEKFLGVELQKSSFEVKVKELEAELLALKKSHQTEVQKLEKTIHKKSEQQANKTKKGKTRKSASDTIDIGVNTEESVAKPLMVDKCTLTKDFYHIKDNPYPIFCERCETLVEPNLEKICKIMTSHPPLLDKVPSPPRRVVQRPITPQVSLRNDGRVTPLTESIPEIENLKEKLATLERKLKKRNRQKSPEIQRANANCCGYAHSSNCCNRGPMHGNAPNMQMDMMNEFWNRIMKFSNNTGQKSPPAVRSKKKSGKLANKHRMQKVVAKKKKNKCNDMNSWEVEPNEFEISDDTESLNGPHILRRRSSVTSEPISNKTEKSSTVGAKSKLRKNAVEKKKNSEEPETPEVDEPRKKRICTPRRNSSRIHERNLSSEKSVKKTRSNDRSVVNRKDAFNDSSKSEEDEPEELKSADSWQNSISDEFLREHSPDGMENDVSLEKFHSDGGVVDTDFSDAEIAQIPSAKRITRKRKRESPPKTTNRSKLLGKLRALKKNTKIVAPAGQTNAKKPPAPSLSSGSTRSETISSELEILPAKKQRIAHVPKPVSIEPRPTRTKKRESIPDIHDKNSPNSAEVSKLSEKANSTNASCPLESPTRRKEASTNLTKQSESMQSSNTVKSILDQIPDELSSRPSEREKSGQKVDSAERKIQEENPAQIQKPIPVPTSSSTKETAPAQPVSLDDATSDAAPNSLTITPVRLNRHSFLAKSPMASPKSQTTEEAEKIPTEQNSEVNSTPISPNGDSTVAIEDSSANDEKSKKIDEGPSPNKNRLQPSDNPASESETESKCQRKIVDYENSLFDGRSPRKKKAKIVNKSSEDLVKDLPSKRVLRDKESVVGSQQEIVYQYTSIGSGLEIADPAVHQRGIRNLATMLGRHLLAEKEKPRSKGTALRNAAAKRLQAIAEKDVKDELVKLVEREEWILGADVITKMGRIASPRTVAKSIVNFLVERANLSEPLDRTYTPPAPVMTRTQQRITALINGLERDPSMSGVFGLVYAGVEYNLFRLSASIQVEVVEQLARMLVVMVRMKKDREKARILCCDAVYSLGRKATHVIQIVLSTWPEVLPMHDPERLGDLPKCLVHIIRMEHVPKAISLKKLLHAYYQYPENTSNSTVFIRESLEALKTNYTGTLATSILLVAKYEGTEWTYKNIINACLMEIINDDSNPSQSNLITLLGYLLRIFPLNGEDKIVENSVKKFAKMLESSTDLPEKSEGLISALLSLTRHGVLANEIADAVLSWKPSQTMRATTIEQLFAFFKLHSTEWWRLRRQPKCGQNFKRK